MRLSILDDGHSFNTKFLFVLIRILSREPVLDAIKLAKFRPDFYGRLASKLTHEALRGDSAWSVGDRELMAAFIAQENDSEWCRLAHAAVAERAYHDDGRGRVPLPGFESEAIEEPLRATLQLLQKLTRKHTIDAEDMRTVLAAGASREQIEDALAVCFALNVTTRLANAFGFTMASPRAYDAGAKYLLMRGYR